MEILIFAAVGLVLGVMSSVVTRKKGILAGVLFAVVFVGLGMVWVLPTMGFTAMGAAFFAFAVSSNIFDPKPKKQYA